MVLPSGLGSSFSNLAALFGGKIRGAGCTTRRPPLRPRATAWGFLRCFLGFRVSGPPVAVSTARSAFLIGSEVLLERFGMTGISVAQMKGQIKGAKSSNWPTTVCFQEGKAVRSGTSTSHWAEEGGYGASR